MKRFKVVDTPLDGQLRENGREGQGAREEGVSSFRDSHLSWMSLRVPGTQCIAGDSKRKSWVTQERSNLHFFVDRKGARNALVGARRIASAEEILTKRKTACRKERRDFS